MAPASLASQHTGESASNHESPLTECFEDDSCKPSEGSISNQCSSLEDSDDDGAWISTHDATLLRAMTTPAAPAARAKRSQLSPQYLHIKKLPRGTKPVRLIGEGSANAVFEFKVPRQGSGAFDCNGLLLRVSKEPLHGRQTSYNYLHQQKYYCNAVKPVLGDAAVHQELVVLRNTGIIDELNAFLLRINDTRKPKFQNTLVRRSDWGLLVEDMRPADPEEYLLVEFKPKWLSQSPSAPSDAIRCRQCALNLRNFIKHPTKASASPSRKPCPLTLANPHAGLRVSSPFRLAPQLSGNAESDHFAQELEKVANHPILGDLRAHQERLDKTGPLTATIDDASFALAMTIRDCTCFVQLRRKASSSSESSSLNQLKFGDLDWKDPQLKLDYWRDTEADLISGGFYSADLIVCRNISYYPPTLCELASQSPKHKDYNHSMPIILVRGTESPPYNSITAHSAEACFQTKCKVRHHTTSDLDGLENILQSIGAMATDYMADANP